MRDCAALTDSIHAGLDTTKEARSLLEQGIGDALLLDDERGLQGFALCHSGPGSEIGSGRCYLKFAAVRGDAGEAGLARLLAACQQYANERAARRLVLGVSSGRGRAYRQLLAQGFAIDQAGVSMHRPNDVGYDRDEVFVLDDWR